MSKSLKSEILHQAVRENIATTGERLQEIQDRHRAAARTRSGPGLSARQRFVLVATSFAVVVVLTWFVGAQIRSRSGSAGAAAAAADPPFAVSTSSPFDSGMPNKALLEATIFPAPQRIDAEVFPLTVDRIMIDPGHGGHDHGTVGNDLREKDLTIDIARRLSERLRKAGFEVEMTRTDDSAVSLRDRALVANKSRADLFVSIHVNWMSMSSIRGVETYYLGATEDPELNERARRENRESGYSLADLKQLLESIYTDVRIDESRQFAARIQRALVTSLRRVNPDLRNRGVKSAPFVVLVATDMPAILAEVSCLSNKEEAELLARPLYRDSIAESLYRGIRGYVEDVKQSGEKES